MNAHNNVLFLCRRTEQSYNSRNCMTAFLEIVPWGYFLIGCCFYFFVFCHKTMSRREKGSAVYLIFVANKVWAKLTYNSFSIANFCCLWRTLCELLLNVPTTGHKWLVGYCSDSRTILHNDGVNINSRNWNISFPSLNNKFSPQKDWHHSPSFSHYGPFKYYVWVFWGLFWTTYLTFDP